MKKRPVLLFIAFFASAVVHLAETAAQQPATGNTGQGQPAFSQQILLPAPISIMDGHRLYTVANTHSHNDYEQPTPFWMAYQEQFGSIEADIFWLNGQLIVAHNLRETQAG